MTAREVFEIQWKLREAEVTLSNVAALLDQEIRAAQSRGLGMVGTMFDHPDYRAAAAVVAERKAAAESAQSAVGGVVYRVANAKLDSLVKKLEALNKRAAKHGFDGLSYRVTDEVDVVEETESWNPEDGVALITTVASVTRFTYVTLAASRLKLAGWAMLAKLSVEEAGVMVSKVPAFSRAWTLHHEGKTMEAPGGWGKNDAAVAAAQETLDAINLGKFADVKTATHCDHCNLSRRRTATFVVENLDTGEMKQVGSNCLRDFLGVDPHQLAKFAELLFDLEQDLESDEEGGFGGGAKSEIPVEDYLMHVCTMIRTYGWAAKSSSADPTAHQASENRYLFLKKKRDSRTGTPMWTDPTEKDLLDARAALAWAAETFGAVEPRMLSDFDRNMLIAASATVVTDRIQGTLAYLPVAHARFLEKQIELANKKEAQLDEFFGEIKQRIELTLMVERVYPSQGDYDTTFITTMRDADGRKFKWFGSYELERGEIYTGKWTVKKHEESEKYGKETVVNRPGNLVVVEAVAA